ncbi:hypothetical protein SELMODRAFT_101544 [Selaginella moellendorffii]|uniref:Uncharacterized protein n=1 Tax=Selaginella moellendorffii TaxID=88036 RepID=D8RTF7_SELML|nr:hypothetical protein SELMODRAFT_101544 [Selaginella moellendorffii]
MAENGRNDSGDYHASDQPPPQERDRTYFITLPVRTLTDFVPEEHLSKLSLYLGIYAILFIIAGIIGILFPLVFALAVEQLIAWLLILGGVFSIVQFIAVCGAPGTTSFLLLGILHLGIGLLMLIKPIEGGMALVYVLSGWFLVHGLLKSLMACQVRNMTSWPAVLASGILSVILAFAILILAPKFGLVLLGVIFGADLLVSGLSMLFIATIAFCGMRDSFFSFGFW